MEVAATLLVAHSQGWPAAAQRRIRKEGQMPPQRQQVTNSRLHLPAESQSLDTGAASGKQSDIVFSNARSRCMRHGL